MHGAAVGGQRAAGGVLELLAGREGGLVADDAGTDDLFDAALGVGDDPVTIEQLDGLLALVGDGHRVAEEPAILLGQRTLGIELWDDPDAYAAYGYDAARLVIVSVGTSLPELATALAAARRRQTDLVLGNILGSNLFNTLAVAGLAGIAGPGVADPTFHDALVLMVGAGVLAGVFGIRSPIERWEGVVLLIVFLAFVVVAV